MSAYLFDDPAKPTSYEPGSEGKIAVLAARRERGLPLWVAGDREGARKVSDAQPSAVTQKSQVERCLIGALNGKEQCVKQLAARAGYKPSQSVRRALRLLVEAGVAIKGRRGFRLSEVAEV